MASRFYVVAQLGAEALGERFLALDAAVKTGKPPEFRITRFRKELCARPELVRALEVETNAELPLSHPNILRLAGAGAWDGCCFVAYEKLDSTSLAEAWKHAGRKPLDPTLVMTLALSLLDALAYAHSGVEDRAGRRQQAFQTAFTPEAVELTRSGLVKVRGFATTSLHETRRPNPLDLAYGRVAYLAPEILDSGKATAKTDLFSLGTLLWELLTGQPLFRKNTSDESAAAVRSREVPPVSTLAPMVRAEIESFVSRLLLRDPAFQFRDAPEAKAVLEKALFSVDGKAPKDTFAAWCQAHVLPEEPRERGGARKVIAEIVSSRELAKALAASPAPKPAAEPAQSSRERNAPEKSAADPAPWEKSGVKIVADEPDPEPPKRPMVPRGVLLAAGCVATLLLVGVGGLLFSPDSLSVHGVLGSVVDRAASAFRGGGGAGRNLPAVFAFRDRRETSRRVFVQGLRQEAENFFVPCGEKGDRCRCEFYSTANASGSPDASAPALVSRKFNYAYCDPPEGIQAPFVRIASGGEKPVKTNLLQVVTELSWSNLLGPALLPGRVRWISRYECDRTFLEGEGVDPSGGAITCTAGQHLGILTSTFSFYTYRSEDGRSEPGKSVDFKSAVCGISNLTKVRCQDSGFVGQAGLYREPAPPFDIPVSLYLAPNGDDPIAVVGYAAAPDKLGNCPVGFLATSLWNAEVPSPAEAAPEAGVLPTNLVNKSGELSDRIFAPIEPRPLEVTRRKNRTPCDGKGDCSLAAFEDVRSAMSVPFKALSALCVLPPSYADDPPRGSDTGKILGATPEKAPEAVVELRTSTPAFEVSVNGKKVPVEAGKIRVPLHKELKLELSKLGYKTQRLTIPPLESMEPRSYDLPSEKVLVGSVDLDSFPRSEATFWLGDEKIFSGNTPVKESLPAGKYRVKFKTLRTGAESEREVVIQDGKTTVVDQLISERAKP